MIPSEDWFSKHSAYLETPAWQSKRQAVLTRDGCCLAQLEGCTGAAEQVHHLNYRHWRNEPLFELIAVCAACHAAITQMDRGAPADAVLEEIRAARREHEELATRAELDRLKDLLDHARGDRPDVDPTRAWSFKLLQDRADVLEQQLAATATRSNAQ